MASSRLPSLFKQATTLKSRTVAATVRESLSKTLASGVVKDRWLRDGDAVHIVDVQCNKNGHLARVVWEAQHEELDDVAQVQRGLQRKRGILREHVNSYVNQRIAVQLEFVHVSQLTREVTQMAGSQALFERMAQEASAYERARDEADEPPEEPADAARQRRMEEMLQRSEALHGGRSEECDSDSGWRDGTGPGG